MCVIDDAQWLDSASAQALAFVARRLLAESVVLLFAAREPGDAFPGLPELVVEGLPDADARALLASVIPGRMDARIADELVAETRRNPLALLELPRGLAAAQLAGGFRVAGSAVASEPDRGELPDAAARPCPRRRSSCCLSPRRSRPAIQAILWRAAERVGITGPALEPAESAGLIEVDGRVRFRHPLVRSAVYRAASPDGAPAGTSSIGRGDRRAGATPTGAPGTSPRRRPALTRTSPPSSSGPPAGRRRGAGWPPRQRFWSGPPR